jgi:hypothetical protein
MTGTTAKAHLYDQLMEPPQGLQRAQPLQAPPDEAGDVDARPGGSRAT